MAEVVCPECGTHTDLPAIRRAAEEFCRNCDYPLFWAPSAVPATSRGGINHDSTLRRLPGAGGRHRVGTKVCPACGELNPLGIEFCIRCNTELDPKPSEPVVEVVVVPPPEPQPVPIPTKSSPWWPWIVLAVVLTLAILAIIEFG